MINSWRVIKELIRNCNFSTAASSVTQRFAREAQSRQGFRHLCGRARSTTHHKSPTRQAHRTSSQVVISFSINYVVVILKLNYSQENFVVILLQAFQLNVRGWYSDHVSGLTHVLLAMGRPVQWKSTKFAKRTSVSRLVSASLASEGEIIDGNAKVRHNYIIA